MATNVTEVRFAPAIVMRFRRIDASNWTIQYGRATTLDAAGNAVREIERAALEDLLSNAEKIALRDALNAAVAKFATLRGVDAI